MNIVAEHIDLTTSTKLPKSTKYRASIEADSEEYTAGRLNKESGVLDSNTTIYATPATSSVAHLVLKQYNHQYIQVTTYNKAGEVDKVYKKQEVVTLKINSQYSVELIADIGYTKSTLVNIDNRKYKIFKNKFIYAQDDAAPKTCTIKIPKTENQIISFVSSYGVYSSSTTVDKTYTVPYDTEYFVEAKSIKDGYIAGNINNHTTNTPYTLKSGSTGFDLDTLTLVLTVSPVTQKKIKFYIPSYAHQKISVTVGANTYTSTDSPVEISYGSNYTSKLEVDKGYVPGRLRPKLNYQTPEEEATEKLTGKAYGDIQFYASNEVKIDSGILMIDFLDGDKKTERFCDWYTHYHELDDTKPQIMIDLIDNAHKDEPLYTELSLTPNEKATNFRHLNKKPTEFEWYYLNHLDEENKITRYIVQIKQTPNQTIRVEYNGVQYTKSFSVPKNAKIKATLTVIDSDKYLKGQLNIPENTELVITHTTTIEATPVKLARCKVVIPQYPNQRLVVTYKGTKYYTDFWAKNGDTITVEVESTNPMYDPGHILSPTITVTDTTILSATPATPKRFTVTVTPYDINQRIEYKADGVVYHETKQFPYNTTISSISIIANDGYTIIDNTAYTLAGTYTDMGDKLILQGDLAITSTVPSVIKRYRFFIIPSDHQTIKVTYYYGGTLRQLTNGSADVPYGSSIWVEILANEGYTAGSFIVPTNLTHESGNKYIVIGDCEIRATDAIRQKFRITIVHPAHGNVVCRINNNTVLTSSFDAYYGDYIFYRCYPSSGYTEGTVDVSGTFISTEFPNTIKVSGPVTITGHDGVLKTYNILVPNYAHQTVKIIYKGVTYNPGDTVTVTHNDKITVTVTPDPNYTAGSVYFEGNVIDHADGTYTIKGNCTLHVADAEPVKRHIIINQVTHQRICIMYLGNYYYESFDVPDGVDLFINIIPDDGYEAGNIHITGNYTLKPGHIYTVGSDLNITATPATIRKYNFKIDTTDVLVSPSNNTFTNQSIRFLYGPDESHITTLNVPTNGAIHVYQVPMNSLVKVELIPNAHYNAGTVTYIGNMADGPNGYKIIKGDMEMTATPAVPESEHITITNTDIDKQYIRVSDKNGHSYTTDFDIPYNEIIYIAVISKDSKKWTPGKFKITGSYTEQTIGGIKAFKITGPCTVTSDPATKRKYKLRAQLTEHNKLYININGDGSSSDIYTEITTLYPNDIHYDDIIRYKITTDDPAYSPGTLTVTGAHKNTDGTYTVRADVLFKVEATISSKTITITKLYTFPGSLSIHYKKPDGTGTVVKLETPRENESITINVTMNADIDIYTLPESDRYVLPSIISTDWIISSPNIPTLWTPVNQRHIVVRATENSTVTFKKLEDTTVSLKGWAYDNIPNYANATTIPADKLVYLNSGLKANNMMCMFAAHPKNELDYTSYDTKLNSIPRLNIDTKYVEDFSYFASYCTYLSNIDLTWLNLSNAVTVRRMFGNCESLESIDLSHITTSDKLTNTSGLFEGCKNLTSIKFSASFNTKNVNTAYSVFRYCKKINKIDLSMLNLTNIAKISGMFQDNENLTEIKIPSNFGNNNSMHRIATLFNGCKNLPTDQITHVIHAMDLSNTYGDLSHIFKDCYKLTNIDISHIGLVSHIDMYNSFSDCIELVSAKLPIIPSAFTVYFEGTFSGCIKLTSIDIPNSLNSIKVTSMDYIFYNCKLLSSSVINPILKMVNTNELIGANGAFSGCESVTSLDLSSWNIGDKLISIAYLFKKCKNLVKVNLPAWNSTTNAKRIENLFEGCEKLTSIDLSKWNIIIDDMAYELFNRCSSIKVIDIGSFDTLTKSALTNHIFDGCISLKYLIIESTIFKFNLTSDESHIPATCKILVPNDLVLQYQTEPHWLKHASKIEPIEYYTINRPGDGTVSVQSKIKGYCKFINNHGETIGRIAFDKNGTLLLSSPIPSVTDAPAGKHFFGWTFNNVVDYTPAQVEASGFFMSMINNGILDVSLYAVYRT